MSWKNGDYFGSNNPYHEVQEFPICPIVELIDTEGVNTSFSFTSASLYKDFLIWATWGPLHEGWSMRVTKQTDLRDDAGTERYNKLMDDFLDYRNSHAFIDC